MIAFVAIERIAKVTDCAAASRSLSRPVCNAHAIVVLVRHELAESAIPDLLIEARNGFLDFPLALGRAVLIIRFGLFVPVLGLVEPDP